MRPILLALTILVGSGTAHAFHTPSVFDDSILEGGGNRLYFTGSPRQKGYDCGVCHVVGDKRIGASVELVPAVTGAYSPGQMYMVTVTLTGEHRGFGVASNQNTFLAEALDDNNISMGTLTTPDQDATRLIDDGRVIGGLSTGEGTTSWKFNWLAPAAGSGVVTMHVGVVDGDGASSPTELTDPGGDDWVVSKLRLCEGTAGCGERPAQEVTESRVACNAGGGSASLLVGILLVLGIVTRRRRSALLALALVGCFDPKGKEECPNRVCGPTSAALNDGRLACAESWSCTPWEAPAGSDMGTRTCTDKNNRGTTECKPDVGPTALPALDMEMFKCDIHPILQADCSMMGCHGTMEGRPFRVYARGRLRNDETVNRIGSCIPATGQVNLDEAGTGTIMCEGRMAHTATEWKKNFDGTRSFMLGVTNPEESLMLTMPAVGGLTHIDIKLFDKSDPKYTKIKNWLGGAKRGSTCNTGMN